MKNFLILLVSLISFGCADTHDTISRDEAASFFAITAERVQQEYVDEVSNKKLLEGALTGMLANLDANSTYLTPEQYKAIQNRTQGEYGGLGLEFLIDNGFLRVVTVMPNTPAARAGLKPDDWIAMIDGVSTVGMKPDDIVRRSHGKPGTSVKLLIRRRNSEPFQVTVVRQLIQITPVKWVIQGQIGYIRLLTFNEKAPAQLKEAILEIQKKVGSNLKGIILDVRNNTGGLFPESLDVADLFLDGGEIVSTRGRHNQVEIFMAHPGDILNGLPLVVLINGVSASASEIVAGALQDHHRALVVGMKSFGKASVQTVMGLKNGGAIKITTARYYTPSGRSIEETGIIPDIILEQRPGATPILKKDFENAYKANDFFPWAPNGPDQYKKPPELGDIKEDYQLRYAFKLLQERKEGQKF